MERVIGIIRDYMGGFVFGLFEFVVGYFFVFLISGILDFVFMVRIFLFGS